jgi:hypothetical protein
MPGEQEEAHPNHPQEERKHLRQYELQERQDQDRQPALPLQKLLRLHREIHFDAARAGLLPPGWQHQAAEHSVLLELVPVQVRRHLEEAESAHLQQHRLRKWAQRH